MNIPDVTSKISVDEEHNKIEMTFKSGDLTRASESTTATDLKEGQKINGLIKRIEDYGMFIDIEGTRLHGLCHKSQLSDNPKADVAEALRGFRVGDRVKAMVVAAEKGRISLSLKPSHFQEEDFEEAASASGEEARSELGAADEDEAEDADILSDAEEDAIPEGSDEEDDDDDEAMQVDIDDSTPAFKQSTALPAASSSKSIPSLTLSEGFQWFGEPHDSDEEKDDASSDESDREGEPSKKKKKKRKEIEKDLTGDMHTKAPESNSDFERLLLGSPNSSYLWIQYMSFQLQISEIDKAREIGRRAAKTISFREEGERLNVWIALLNLENVYGTDESIEATFKDAARANDSKTIHLRLAAIFDQSGKPEASYLAT